MKPCHCGTIIKMYTSYIPCRFGAAKNSHIRPFRATQYGITCWNGALCGRWCYHIRCQWRMKVLWSKLFAIDYTLTWRWSCLPYGNEKHVKKRYRFYYKFYGDNWKCKIRCYVHIVNGYPLVLINQHGNKIKFPIYPNVTTGTDFNKVWENLAKNSCHSWLVDAANEVTFYGHHPKLVDQTTRTYCVIHMVCLLKIIVSFFSSSHCNI